MGDLPTVLAVVAVLLVVSAVHDTALGGLAVRLLPPGERGTGNGVQAAAATASIFIGGGGALLLYAYVGWTATTLAVAAVFAVPLAVLVRFTEPAAPQGPVRDHVGWRDLVAVLRVRRTAVWVLAVLPCFVTGPALVLAGQLGYPWLITGALGLTIAGAAVAATWARSHAVP